MIWVLFILCCSISLNAQTPDSTAVRPATSVKYGSKPVQRIERMPVKSDVVLSLYGDYTITRYVTLSSKALSAEELNTLLGTIVKFQATSLTGTGIDPLTYEIYQVERQLRDDFVFRVFGPDVKTHSNLPESFTVHKTDNENCYGIVEIGNGEIAIPYKGVLLYMKRN